MALEGEAYVEIHADLRPFARDLRQNLKPIVEAFEKQLSDAVSRAGVGGSREQGGKAGEEYGRGFRNSFVSLFSRGNPFLAIVGMLGSALDDGISALPTEIKAALVVGIAAAAPVIAAMLTGAIVGALGVAVTGLGVLLGSQFQSVQDRASETFRVLRRDLVASASAFEPALLSALNRIQRRVQMMSADFETLFGESADFVAPLVEGALDAIERIVSTLADLVPKFRPFIAEIANGFNTLGIAISDALETLVATGEDGVIALRDLFLAVAAIIGVSAKLLAFFTRLYGAIRRMAQEIHPLLLVILPLLIPLKLWGDASDDIANKNEKLTDVNFGLEQGLGGLIAATDAETRALQQYRDAIDDASDAVKNQLELEISWEASLDAISDALKRNGRNLNIQTEQGRQNVNAFLDALRIAEERNVERVRRGEMTAEQAAASFQKEIDQVRNLARQAGIADESFNALFQEIIDTAALRISSQEMGVDALAGEIGSAEDVARRLYDQLMMIKNLRLNIGQGALAGVRQFSDGGVVSLPETVSVAEDGPEAIIPLTKPGRAAQIMQDTGLSALLGGGPTQVLVFIGQEQLEARMVRVVARNNRAQSLALSHGGRTV